MSVSPILQRAAGRAGLIALALALALAMLLLPTVARAADTPDLTVAPSTGLTNGATVAVTASAPIQMTGPVTQATTVQWNPAVAVLTGAATAPQGWTPEYTTDGTTWSSALPADPATVVGARASGPVQSDGVSGGRQAVTTVNNASSVTPPPTFPAAGGGDGYDIFGAPDYLLTAYHHTTPFTLSCFTRAGGGACSTPVYTRTGYQTSYASNGIVIGNKTYVFLMEGWLQSYGVLCTDMSTMPFTSCGYTQLVPYTANTYNPPNVFLGTTARAGTKIYGAIHTGYNAGPNWASLACFDTATNLPCVGQPYLNASHGGNGTGNIQSQGSSSASTLTSAFADRVFTAGRELWCVNAGDGTPCTGWGTVGSPTSVALTGSVTTNPVPLRDTSGAITGVCVLAQGAGSTICRNLDQTAATAPTGLTNLITSFPVMNGGLQAYAYGDTRTYWLTPSGPNGYPVCYDWTTDAGCAGFGSTIAAAERYTLTLDEFDPDCAYTYGNNAVVTTFNARIGGALCGAGPKMSLSAQASVPRLGCSGTSSILAWGTIKVTPPGGLSVTAFRVTVRDSQGLPIPGYSDMLPNAQGVVDVSGLPPSASGQSPTITVVATGATLGQANATTIAVTRQTDFPQLCLPMEARASCATAAPGSFPGGVVALTPLALTGEVVETPSAGSAQTFPLSGSATRAGLPGCLGGIDGTVRFTDGTPAPGKTVTLKAPDGTVVATATTSATGAYAFPSDLGPVQGYTVEVEGVVQTAGVTANATTTVDFSLPLPPPAPPAVPAQVKVSVAPSTTATAGEVLRIVVTVPSEGTVAVVGTTTVAGVPVRACTARKTAKRAGRLVVSCVLSRPVQVLACRRGVRVALRVAFTPTAGRPTVERTSTTVRRARCTVPSVTG